MANLYNRREGYVFVNDTHCPRNTSIILTSILPYKHLSFNLNHERPSHNGANLALLEFHSYEMSFSLSQLSCQRPIGTE